MDFIKSLRSFAPPTNKMNSSRMNSTRMNENPTTSRPPIKRQESLKDRFSEKSKCPTSRYPINNSEKIRQQKEEARKNQRMNKLTSHRIKNAIPTNSTPFITSTSNNASKCESSTNEADLSSTFILAENLSPKKLQLAMWRKERDAAAKKAKIANQRPAWKVTHVDPRILDNRKAYVSCFIYTILIQTMLT